MIENKSLPPIPNQLLLEQAAKACGYKLEVYHNTVHHYRQLMLRNDDIHQSQWEIWNPLESDGQALRLAVTLGFINPGQWPDASYEMELMIRENEPKDWYLATRRAIVKRAAELGARMK